jgi:hypothetical protein
MYKVTLIMTTFNQPSDVEQNVEPHNQDGRGELKSKRVTVGFKIDPEEYAESLDIFPYRGELSWFLQNLYKEQLQRLKKDPAKLPDIHAAFLDNLKEKRVRPKRKKG